MVRTLALLVVTIAGCGPSVQEVLHRAAACDVAGQSGCWVSLARETIPAPSHVPSRSLEDLRREVGASGVHTLPATCYECGCPAEASSDCRAHVVYSVPTQEDEGPTLWDRGWRPVATVVAACADGGREVECPFSLGSP